MPQYNLKTLKEGDIIDLEHATFVVNKIDDNENEYPVSLRLSTIKSVSYKPLEADPNGVKFETLDTEWWIHADYLNDFGITASEAVPTTNYNLDTLKVGDIVKTPYAEFEVEYMPINHDIEYPLCLRLKSILSCKYTPLDAAANTHKAGLWLFNTVGNSYYVMREALPDFGIGVDAAMVLSGVWHGYGWNFRSEEHTSELQ